MEPTYVTAIEIGSSKIRGALGSVDSAGTLTVHAVEEEKVFDCVRHGVIQNVAEVKNRIGLIIKRLEDREPSRRITGAYVAIGGKSLKAQSTDVSRQYSNEIEITPEMVDQIHREAMATTFHDSDVLHVEPREYTVNNQTVRRVYGIMGRSLQAKLNLITARSVMKRNLAEVIENRQHLEVKGYVVRQIAQADLVLSKEDKQLGCMLVDFGSETTTVSIYREGTLRYHATLPMGSRNITRDITALNYLEERAEQFKKVGGNAMVSPGASAIVDGMDYTEINNYVSARAGEIIANINNQIELAGLKKEKLGAGIVIVGSGALLKGFQERLHDTTKLNVRAGISVGDVRIADPRINVTEAIDVISVLRSVAPDAQECTELETVEYYDPEPAAPDATASTPDNNKEDDDDPFEEDEEFDRKSRRSGWGFFQKVRESIAGALNENDDDDLG